MIVEKKDTDYHVRLTTQEIDFLSSPVSKRMEGLLRVKPQLSVLVYGIFPQENMNIACTMDTKVLKSKKAKRGVFFDMKEEGPIVLVHPSSLHDLTYEREYIEYEGIDSKIFIRKDDDQPEQLSLGLPGIRVYPHLIHESPSMTQ